MLSNQRGYVFVFCFFSQIGETTLSITWRIFYLTLQNDIRTANKAQSYCGVYQEKAL